MLENENFTYAGELIKKLVDKLFPHENQDYSRMSVGWEEIAGTEMAMHVFPRDIENGTLVLETDHPGWSQRILMEKESILKKIRGKYSRLEIRRIRVSVGNGQKHNT